MGEKETVFLPPGGLFGRSHLEVQTAAFLGICGCVGGIGRRYFRNWSCIAGGSHILGSNILEVPG